jgi:hypothetical protein
MDRNVRAARVLIIVWTILLLLHGSRVVFSWAWQLPDNALNSWSFVAFPAYLLSWRVATTRFRHTVRTLWFALPPAPWLALWWLARPPPGASVSRALLLPDGQREAAFWAMRLWPWLIAGCMIGWFVLRVRRELVRATSEQLSAV